MLPTSYWRGCPFPNSLAYIQIAACLLISVLPAAFKKFCSNKQGHVTGKSWISWIFQTYLLGWILWKPCHGAICRITLKNLFSPAKKTPTTTTTPNPLWCCSNEGHGFFHSSKNNSRCLKHVLAFSGPSQAHNLTNMFHMNVLSNVNTMEFSYVYSWSDATLLTLT